MEYFLSQVGYPQFEVVIYTQEAGFTAAPIVESLDPQGLIAYKLFRDTTKYMRGIHVKVGSCARVCSAPLLLIG